MRDLPDIVLAAVLMFALAWFAAYDEEERYHVPTVKEVMNERSKEHKFWWQGQTEVKSTSSTRLFDNEGLGEERQRSR